MTLHRVQASTRVTLSHTFLADDVAVDADSGPVTVTVKRLDGTVVATASATHPGTTGLYTYAPPDSDDLDAWTLDWEGLFGGATVRVRDFIEIVGGFLFGIDEARNYGSALTTAAWPTSKLVQRRTAIETIAERISGVAFVPRFCREQLSGNGDCTLMLNRRLLRRVRAVKVGGVAWPQATVDDIAPSKAGIAELVGGVWPWGVGNIVIEYEHGMDFPPVDVSEAAIVHMRSRLNLPAQNVPYRAVSFQAGDGGFYRISQPSAERTGIPEVDAAYLGAGIDPGGFA